MGHHTYTWYPYIIMGYIHYGHHIPIHMVIEHPHTYGVKGHHTPIHYGKGSSHTHTYGVKGHHTPIHMGYHIPSTHKIGYGSSHTHTYGVNGHQKSHTHVHPYILCGRGSSHIWVKGHTPTYAHTSCSARVIMNMVKGHPVLRLLLFSVSGYPSAFMCRLCCDQQVVS